MVNSMVDVQNDVGEFERLQGELAAQKIQLELMKDDYDAQLKELQDVQSELSETAKLSIVCACIKEATSVYNNDPRYGVLQMNSAEGYYCSATGGPETVEFALPHAISLSKIQFVSHYPPKRLELRNLNNQLLCYVTLEKAQKDALYTVNLVQVSPPAAGFKFY